MALTAGSRTVVLPYVPVVQLQVACHVHLHRDWQSGTGCVSDNLNSKSAFKESLSVTSGTGATACAVALRDTQAGTHTKALRDTTSANATTTSARGTTTSARGTASTSGTPAATPASEPPGRVSLPQAVSVPLALAVPVIEAGTAVPHCQCHCQCQCQPASALSVPVSLSA